MSDPNGLRNYIKNNKLYITIGVDLLASGFEQSPDNEEYDEESGEYKKIVKVTNPLEFGKEVLIQMDNEKEDGSSPLTDFLDAMCQAAVNDGSIAVEYKK